MKCVYCELPQIRRRTIVGNNLVRAFPSNMPITPGHTLIAPVRCVPRYEDLTEDEKKGVEGLRVKICDSLRKVFGAEGFNFAWNDGKNCGQSVPHFHLHIVPRKEGDYGIYGYEPRKFLYRPGERETSPEEELVKVSQSIKSNL